MKKKTITYIIALSVFFVCLVNRNVPAFTGKTRIAPPDFKKIRILLDSGKQKNILLSYHSKHPLSIIVNNETAFTVKEKKLSLIFTPHKIQIGKMAIKSTSVFLQLQDSSDYFLYKGHKFFQNLHAERDDKGISYLIHLLALEEYISRVMVGEMPKSAPIEALKAQAIASRTYCTYNILERRLNPYDLTIEAQAFGAHQEQSIPAVKETEGIVINLKDHLIPAFFHTNCGGYTEYSINVWRTHYHYSKIIRCPYCSHSKHYSWKTKYSFSAIEKKLQANGYYIRNIQAIYTHSINPETHRTTKVIMRGKYKDLTLTANTFRLIMNSRKLKSTFFTVSNFSDYAIFKGNGYGHGVGMCQDGAQEMAKKGFSHKDILLFYFPDTVLNKIY